MKSDNFQPIKRYEHSPQVEGYPPPLGSIWCSKLYIRYLAYTKELLELELTMGIHANGFSVDLLIPHYVLHNRSKYLPICYVLTLKLLFK